METAWLDILSAELRYVPPISPTFVLVSHHRCNSRQFRSDPIVFGLPFAFAARSGMDFGEEDMASKGRAFSPEEIRRIVFLLSTTEMSTADIAERMGCSRSAVMAINRKCQVRAYLH